MKLFKVISFIFLLGCSDNTYKYLHNGEEINVYRELSVYPDSVFGIDISNKSLETIPHEIFQNDQLQYLNLNGNDLKVVDSDLCRLTNLKILLLNENKLELLPECIFHMNSLEVLSLLGCGLKIDSEIKGLTNLKTLVIAGNIFSESDLYLISLALPKCKIVHRID